MEVDNIVNWLAISSMTFIQEKNQKALFSDPTLHLLALATTPRWVQRERERWCGRGRW